MATVKISWNPIGIFPGLLVLLILSPAMALPQEQLAKRDSLLKMVSKQNGADKVITLIAISKLYWYVRDDSAAYFALSATQLAEPLVEPNIKAEANRVLAVSYMNMFKETGSIQPLLARSLAEFRSTSNKKGIADSYNNLGSMYKQAKDNKKALAYYDSALVAYQQQNDQKGEAAVLNYIGIVYQDMGEYRKAIDYTLKGLEVREKTNDHLGIVYSNLNVGNIFLAGGQPEIAIRYYLRGNDYAGKHGIATPGMAFNMLGKSYLEIGDLEKAGQYLLPSKGNQYVDKIILGNFFLAQNNLDSAAYYFQRNFADAHSYGDKNGQSRALVGLARINLIKGETNKALTQALAAHSLAEKSDKVTISESAGLLAKLYEASKEPGLALQFMKEQHGILDSMVNSGYQQKLAYFESKADLEKLESNIHSLSLQKELQEQLYKQERLLKNFLLAISLLILVTAFFVIRNINAKKNKIERQNLLLDEQKKLVEKSYAELQSAQAQLIQSEKMASLGVLTAGIAHEIQNPLNFVNNFSEVNTELVGELKAALEIGDKVAIAQITADISENERMISHHGKRAEAIVKGMLQHSRSNTGVKEPVDINKMADEYLRLAYRGFLARDSSFNVSLLADYDETIGLISIVPQDLGRVLLNIFTNAFYAVAERNALPGSVGTGYKPSVTVTTKKTGDMVQLMVQDNGTGIPAANLEKIFQPFFTTKPTGEGTGLGLSLAYDIVKANGGNISLETTAGEGASFTVSLQNS